MNGILVDMNDRWRRYSVDETNYKVKASYKCRCDGDRFHDDGDGDGGVG